MFGNVLKFEQSFSLSWAQLSMSPFASTSAFYFNITRTTDIFCYPYAANKTIIQSYNR